MKMAEKRTGYTMSLTDNQRLRLSALAAAQGRTVTGQVMYMTEENIGLMSDAAKDRFDEILAKSDANA